MTKVITTTELLENFLSQSSKWTYYLKPLLKQSFNDIASIVEELEDMQEKNWLVEDGEFEYTEESVQILIDILNDKSTKYNQEFVYNEIKSLLEELREEKDYIYIWELFQDKNYSRQRFSEWVKDYWHIESIKRDSDTIKEILETRAIKWAMKNELNATSTIFHLKNNYKWVDKQEIDQTSKNINMNHDISDMSDEELDELIN